MSRKIDHIVYAVPDLEKAIATFSKQTGVAPVFGGYHLSQGTKNALVNLGDQCYLEFLAIDVGNTNVTAPRWMGVDLIDRPQITRWSLKSTDLERDSKIVTAHQTAMGIIQQGSREMTNGDILTWGIVMPLPTPKVELIPFMTDWSDSVRHPTDSLADKCQLKSIKLMRPDPGSLQYVLDQLGVPVEIGIGPDISISIEIESGEGVFFI